MAFARFRVRLKVGGLAWHYYGGEKWSTGQMSKAVRIAQSLRRTGLYESAQAVWADSGRVVVSDDLREQYTTDG